MGRFIDVFEKGDSACLTTISALDIKQKGQENLFIVGDVFIQIWYTIFDRDYDRVGLAKAVSNGVEKQHSIHWSAFKDIDEKD